MDVMDQTATPLPSLPKRRERAVRGGVRALLSHPYWWVMQSLRIHGLIRLNYTLRCEYCGTETRRWPHARNHPCSGENAVGRAARRRIQRGLRKGDTLMVAPK